MAELHITSKGMRPNRFFEENPASLTTHAMNAKRLEQQKKAEELAKTESISEPVEAPYEDNSEEVEYSKQTFSKDVSVQAAINIINQMIDIDGIEKYTAADDRKTVTTAKYRRIRDLESAGNEED